MNVNIMISNKITDNIRKDKQGDFLRNRGLAAEYTRSGQKFNHFTQDKINEGKLRLKDVQDFFFDDLFYGYQRDTYIYNVASYEEQYVQEKAFLERIQKFYPHVVGNKYNDIVGIVGEIDEKQIVALEVEYAFDMSQIAKVRLLFGIKNPVYKKGGVKETISYVPVEWNIFENTIVVKVAPKRRPVDKTLQPEYLNRKFLRKLKEIFDIETISFDSMHREAICEMSKDLYMQIYNKMVKAKPVGIDEYVKEISENLKKMLGIEGLELKATINNIFNIEDNLGKSIENVLMSDMIMNMKDGGSFEGIEGVVTYLKFQDGKHISARLKGENCRDPIFDSETYLSLRSAIENAQRIQRLAVVWLDNFDKLRVTYDGTDIECLNVHFYKNLSSEEFEYAMQMYRRYEQRIKDKTNELFEVESQVQ